MGFNSAFKGLNAGNFSNNWAAISCVELVTVLGYSWIFLIFVTLRPFLSFFILSSHSSLLSFLHLERRFGCKWTVAFKTFQPNPIALFRSWPACPCLSTNSRLLFAFGSPSLYLQCVCGASLFLFRSVVQLYITKQNAILHTIFPCHYQHLWTSCRCTRLTASSGPSVSLSCPVHM